MHNEVSLQIHEKGVIFQHLHLQLVFSKYSDRWKQYAFHNTFFKMKTKSNVFSTWGLSLVLAI